MSDLGCSFGPLGERHAVNRAIGPLTDSPVAIVTEAVLRQQTFSATGCGNDTTLSADGFVILLIIDARASYAFCISA